MQYEQGVVDQEVELFDLAVKYGLITRPNNQNYIVLGEKIRGRDAAISYFIEQNAKEEYDLKIRDIYLNGGGPLEVEEVSAEEENPLIGALE